MFEADHHINDTFIYGGQEYISHYLLVAVPYMIILFISCIVGTVGNLCVLVTIVINVRLHTPQNAFLVSLGLADTLVTTIADPISLMGMMQGRVYFESRPVLCDLAAVLCVTACVAALLNIGAISFTQYLFICHPHSAKFVCTTRNCVLLAFAFWVVGIVVAIPTLVGWSNNVFDHKMLECIWDRTYSYSYTIFYTTVAVFGPLTIISFSYIKIFHHVTSVKKRIGQQMHEGKTFNNTKEKLRNDAIKLARTLFIIFIVFAICWTPYSILVLIDYKDELPYEVHLYILLLAHLHATADSIVYGITNKHFQQGYKQIFHVISCKKLTVFRQAVGPSSIELKNSDASQQPPRPYIQHK